MARPTALNPHVQARLVEAFNLGQTSIASACAYAGISEAVYYKWMKQGREGDDRYIEFLEAIEKARADAVLINLGVIRKAAMNGQWQAAAWWLERVLPQQFARRTTVEVVTPDVIEREIARLEAELAGNDTGA